MNPMRDFERKSSASTLSDMEVFVFPELMYALVLANLMSPRIWAWREDPWFADLPQQKPYRRIQRLKQFIMDHYVFNLDLDTWGLTDKKTELARFSPFLDPEMIRQSNALFGYEGDRYYFDIDIRRHFGLDRYDSDAIPYWKTETVEAMDAFRYRPGFSVGAGECVSLATLYAAALFAVAGIPLEDIFLMATPLHSQNFVDVDDGILTNNRRLVTKTMWFNGTAISAQARRALENEQVTIVTHETGHVHTVYGEATIDPDAYARFGRGLGRFLTTRLTPEILGNFLRYRRDLQRCFQVRWPVRGQDRYVALDKAFAYEDGTRFLVTDHTRPKLLSEIDAEDAVPQPLPGRIVLNDLEDYVRAHRPDLHRSEDARALVTQFSCDCMNAELAMQGLIRFCHTEARLPDAAQKRFVPASPRLELNAEMGPDGVRRRLESLRSMHPVADLAFHAFRDLTAVEPEPFLQAAMARSPVCVTGCRELDDASVLARVQALASESIYDGPGRLAQPDEVWNFGRGDGIEKALLLACVLRQRHPDRALSLEVEGTTAHLSAGPEGRWRFETRKGLPVCRWELNTPG